MQSPQPSKNNPKKWKQKNRKKSLKDQDVNVPRSAVWNCTANVSPMDASVQIVAGVLAAGITKTMRMKFWKLKCWLTLDTQEHSKGFQFMYQFGSVRVRNRDARRNIVNASVQGWSVRSFVNADTVTMVRWRWEEGRWKRWWMRVWWKSKSTHELSF